MPLSKDEMREYQRKRRAEEKEGVQRALGNKIIRPGEYLAGHIHTWTRRLGEETARCDCGEIVEWQGKLLNRHTDGLPDTGGLINNMDQHERDRILNSPAINSRKREQ